jgi:hypothetical protein
MRQAVINIIGLQTPAGRLVFFALASAVIFMLPQTVLAEFSLWARVGFEDAPSIGLTRAYNHVLHGNFAAAWARNHLILVVLAVGVPMLLTDVRKLIEDMRR